MSTERKIGLIVAGDIDKAVVEVLGHRVLGDSARLHAVRLGGNFAAQHAWVMTQILLDEKGCEHVIVLIDADSTLSREVDRKRAALEAQLAQHDFTEDETSVCTADPEVEAWLLAHFHERPEDSRDPAGELARQLGVGRVTAADAARLAEEIDLTRARLRSPSLDTFLRALERVSRQSQHAPAA
jgi:hypothetical protein